MSYPDNFVFLSVWWNNDNDSLNLLYMVIFIEFFTTTMHGFSLPSYLQVLKAKYINLLNYIFFL